MADRFTKNWTGKRHKGYRVGTLWGLHSDIDGDVTLSLDFDDLSDTAKIDLLSDFIGLLDRERDTLLEKIPDHVCHAMGWPDREERAPKPAKKIAWKDVEDGTAH
jgi:hypothetical protein